MEPACGGGGSLRGPTMARARRTVAALLGAGVLALSLAACAGEEPSTDPPDPGAPITRSPS